MWKALALKELRELAPIAGISLAIYACIVAQLTGFELVFWPVQVHAGIPFVTDDFAFETTCVSVCLAIALGMRQTLGEQVSGTWVWLLHRPANAHRLIAVKLVVGGAVYLFCAAAPIICYACWAAIPGAHASPFHWSMTVEAWQTWLSIGSIYLASFLCGFWPVRWFGPRLLPLVGVGSLTLLGWVLFMAAIEAPRLVWLVPAALFPLVLASIFFVNRTRDFS